MVVCSWVWVTWYHVIQYNSQQGPSFRISWKVAYRKCCCREPGSEANVIKNKSYGISKPITLSNCHTVTLSHCHTTTSTTVYLDVGKLSQFVWQRWNMAICRVNVLQRHSPANRKWELSELIGWKICDVNNQHPKIIRWQKKSLDKVLSAFMIVTRYVEYPKVG